jgi:cytochrome P450 / NADPH-cytochrome P450 reductase
MGGKYQVNKDDNVICLLAKAHLDPLVFDEPEKFKPERMLEENFRKLPKNSWKPFGNGVRAVSTPLSSQVSQLR